MIIDNKFELGQFVYVITDPDQYKRIVTGIIVNPGVQIMYECSVGNATNNFYDFELSDEKDIELKVNS